MRVNPVVGLLPIASGQACFGMAFTSFLKKHYTPVTLSLLPRLCEQGTPREGEDVTKADINHEVVKM